MSTDASSLTAQDLEFLRRPLHGFLSVARGHFRHSPGRCGSRPLPRARSNCSRPRTRSKCGAYAAIPAPRSSSPPQWVNASAGCRSPAAPQWNPDGAHDLAARLAARYWDLDDPARASDLAEILAADQVRLVIHPETVSRYMY
ncbi:hypothetical protein SAMN05661093_10777 [Kibdelosporangium aridum]|uniref:Uncharacterized protein n=1 Tax=Kibdelosporangium aridum TaxID=2030 RepID=A0A1W2FZ22_KIBAR|nr:hypothetical protein SAMN05661093_10777 [Kibdelosporangium aridum]